MVYNFFIIIFLSYISPEKMLLIIENSNISYNIKTVRKLAKMSKTVKGFNQTGIYIKRENGKVKIKKIAYLNDGETLKKLKKASYLTKRNRLKKAREIYLDVLKKYPNSSKVCIDIAYTYFMRSDFKSSIKWLKKGIKVNFFDYEAHTLLSKVYRWKGDYKNSLKEIIIARIINFSDMKIELDLKNRFYGYWNKNLKIPEFNPNYRIIKGIKKDIYIKIPLSDPFIVPYVLCKAVWENEPKFKKKNRLFGKMITQILKEDECLNNMLDNYKIIKNTQRDLNIETLSKIRDDGYLREFIIYNILLPENPKLIYYLKQKDIDRLIQYVFYNFGEFKKTMVKNSR